MYIIIIVVRKYIFYNVKGMGYPKTDTLLRYAESEVIFWIPHPFTTVDISQKIIKICIFLGNNTLYGI